MIKAIKRYVMLRRADSYRKRAEMCWSVAQAAISDARYYEERAIRAKIEARRLCAKANIDIAFATAGESIHSRARH